MISFNRSPYYDDFEGSKKFHRILYRPSYAVQARELTQQQTILQAQISRFGEHIFKNGSMVIPGHIMFDTEVFYVKINAAYNGFEVDETAFIGSIIEGVTSGAKAEVMLSSGVEGTDPKTLYIKYTDSGPLNALSFLDGEVLQIVANTNVKCEVRGTFDGTSTLNIGDSCIASIQEGIYFINGYFVIVDTQSIVASKYTNNPSLKIGLQLYEYIVTAEDDASLRDNAQGSYNYAAPGADRYKLDLKLETAGIDDILNDDFIEIQRIDAGYIVNEVRDPEYNELEKTLARRTYDESGDYTVRKYNLNIKEHLLDPLIPRLKNGRYLAIEGGDESKIAIGVEPGKSYVRGFERSNIATTWVPSNKARTTSANNNSVTNCNIGQFIYIQQLHKFPDIAKYATIKLYDVAGSDGVLSSVNNLIGTARVRGIQLVESDATPSLSVYKLFLFDIAINTGRAWSEVLWIESQDTDLIFTASTDIDISSAYYDYAFSIQQPANKTSVFHLPHQYIKTLKIDGVSDTTYTVQRTYTNKSSNAGVIAISAGSNQLFDTYNGSNYVVMNINGTTANNSFVPISSVTLVAGGASVEINLGAYPDSDFRVILPVIKTVAVEKTKTKQTAVFDIVGADINLIPSGYNVLNKADGYRLVSVMLNSVTDITNRYEFDSGQREAFYDLARIRLRNDAAPVKSTDTLTVTYEYFSHGAGDYSSVDSYSTLDYSEIPFFFSESGVFALSDCVDFRPVANSSGGWDTSNELPIPLSNFRSDYEYYLGRIDKLVIDYTGIFNVIEGQPSSSPKPPKSPDNAMLLFEITMNPYGVSVADIKPKFIENKRYTMRDIGSLEKRIGNLEYYTALSLLERETAEFQIKDENGLDRFKNGFIVEPFNSHALGDSTSIDYKCSIDQTEEKMRPTFSSDSIDLEFDPDLSVNVVRNGNLVTLPFTSVALISQTLNSTSENINPFAVRSFRGVMDFNPDSDNWYDTSKNGTIIVNDDENMAALQQIADQANLNGITWNDWETTWTGVEYSHRYGWNRYLGLDGAGGPSWYGNVRYPYNNNLNGWYNGDYYGGVDGWYSDNYYDRGFNNYNDITWNNYWYQTHGWSRNWLATTVSSQERTGLQTTSTVNISERDIGDRVVSMNYIPYMRSIAILIKVENMKPNTIIYPFFDDIDVAPYCIQASRVAISSKVGDFLTNNKSEEYVTSSGGGNAKIVFQSPSELAFVEWDGIGFASGQTVIGSTSGSTAVLAANLVLNSASGPFTTDALGRVAMMFRIPSNDTLKFRTGDRTFLLTDQINNTQYNQTVSQGIFKSEGVMNITEGTILSTATLQTTTNTVEEERIVRNTNLFGWGWNKHDKRARRYSASGWPYSYCYDDPLAQTFLIEDEGGCFVTKCDIYFKDKDSENRPVIFQIREVENGYPDQAVAPYSEVIKYPHEITTSTDGSVATTFVLNSPVYLQQGTEYCFVLLTDSFDYNVWIGEVGQTDIISNNLISKQPATGVLFKSQNASTWTANQLQDMKFILYKARFAIETAEGSGVPNYGETVLHNKSLSPAYIGSNPLETFEGSNLVRVRHYSHGFSNGSTVTLSGFDDSEGLFNNIPASEINGSHIVYRVEIDSYVIQVSTLANDSGLVGGNTGLATRNVQLDVFRPNITEVIVTGAGSSWFVRSTSGQSVNGNQTPYVKESSYSLINVTENNFFNTAKVIASDDNENISMAGEKSLDVKNVIFSNNRNISPVLDLGRASCIAVGNRIDYPSYDTANKTITVTAGSYEVVVSHVDHGISTGTFVEISASTTIGSLTASELSGFFGITRIDDDSYKFKVISNTTPTNGSGLVSVTWSTSHYKNIPENVPAGSSGIARYITRRITLEEPAVAVKIIISAVAMDEAEFEIWYKKQSPSDNNLFENLPWTKLTTDSFVALSSNITDYRDYEYTKEFFIDEPTNSIPDEYTSIAFKLVMKSTNSNRVPIFDNLRVICLGT